MRRLGTKDVFSAFRLVKAAGLKQEVEAMALQVNKGEKLDIHEVGISFVVNVIDGLASIDSEKKFYEFCAGPFEMTVEEVEELPFFDLIDKLKELAGMEDKEAWKNFFHSVASLMKK